jgi:hypothetical protein
VSALLDTGTQMTPGMNASTMVQPGYMFVCTGIRVPAMIDILANVSECVRDEPSLLC